MGKDSKSKRGGVDGEDGKGSTAGFQAEEEHAQWHGGKERGGLL